MLRGLDPVAHLTRRLIDRYFRRPSPTSRAPPRLFGLEGIKLTNQALSIVETSRRGSKTSHDPSSVALGIAVVAQLTPVLRPLEFVYGYALSREFSSFVCWLVGWYWLVVVSSDKLCRVPLRGK